MNSQPPWVNHHGAVIHRERNRKRVRRPPSIGVRAKAHDQSNVACAFSPAGRQMGSRMQCQGALRLEALNDQAALGFRRSVGDEVAETDLLQSGMIRFALGQFAGNSSLSTQRAVYQPARCQPICTSHGQTASGGASMVMAGLSPPRGWALCRPRESTWAFLGRGSVGSGRDVSVPVRRR